MFGGVPAAQPEMAATFFRDWFDAEDKLISVITRINPVKLAAQSERLNHLHQPPTVFREAFESASMDDLIYSDGVRYNLYMGVGLLSKAPDVGRKGGKRDVVRVPGVWVDLDVGKDGVFRDEEHALSLLRSVKPWPTIVVATGTGGVHAYWKVRGGLGPQDAEELVARWWAHLSAEADAKIDKLVNCDRIMKLPGSIRWEKDPGDQPALVRLLHSSTETVKAGELVRVSEAAWLDYRDRVTRKRREVEERRLAVHTLTASELSRAGRWGPLLSAIGLEDEFNETHTWHEVLEPLGWLDIGSDSDGRTLWARPDQSRGATYKSAATDFQGSHVMTLFSDSPITNLWPLNEAGIPLTKYRVWVQTRYGGDDEAYARDVHGLD